jgi:hypothetical protein
MFGTIRKHQTWLWAIIITLTIISFVIFFSPYSRLDSRGGPVNLGSINGQKISEEQYLNAMKDVQLQFFFMSGGRWPDDEAARRSGFDLEREVYQWMLLVQKANQFGIHVGQDTVAQVARQMIDNLFQRQPQGSPAQIFLKQVLEPRRLSLADFQRFVGNYLSIQQLIATVGLTGKLVTPEDAKALYRRDKQEVAAEALFFSASNYLQSVQTTPDIIQQYYTNPVHQAEFRVPERMQVRYVRYDISNYLARAQEELAKTNMAARIDENIKQMGTNYLRYGATPEEAKGKIIEELTRNQALYFARQEAAQFTDKLYAMEPIKVENLDMLARSNGLAVKVTAPFDRREGPKDIQGGVNFATEAFSLSPTGDLFKGPVVGDDGAYVVGFYQKYPSEIPPLDAIRERVEAAYKSDQAKALARSTAVMTYATLTNALAQGKAFPAAAADAKVAVTELPPVSLSTRSLPPALEERVTLNELKQLMFGTAPGKLSPPQPTPDGSVMVYVKAKLPVDESKMVGEMPAFLNFVRQNRTTEAFNEWFRKEANTGLQDTPVFRPRNTPTVSKNPSAKS